MCKEELTASEALYGFLSWMVVSPNSKSEFTRALCISVDDFCYANKLKRPELGYLQKVTIPEIMPEELPSETKKMKK